MRHQSFVGRVLTGQEKNLAILYSTGRNVAKKASKLGRYSVLIKGTTLRCPGRWFEPVLASHLG